MPPAAATIWEWFWDLHKGRQMGAQSWQALSATEMKAWADMTGNIVLREEWQILRDMDRVFLDQVNARDKDGQPIPASSHDISAASFDAMFG